MITYLDMDQVGAWFGVTRATVAKWRARYAGDHPTPEPDAMVGRSPGWLPSRETEWRAWEAERAGQMSGLRRRTSA